MDGDEQNEKRVRAKSSYRSLSIHESRRGTPKRPADIGTSKE